MCVCFMLVGSIGVWCEYCSIQVVDLLLMCICSVGFDVNEVGCSVIWLELELEQQVNWSKFDFKMLCLYLYVDVLVVFILCYYLFDCVECMIVCDFQGYLFCIDCLGVGCFWQVGFEVGECLWFFSNVVFVGYELLQEYFVFCEKFLFIDFCGMEVFYFYVDICCVMLDFVFDKVLFVDLCFGIENICLYCMLIINFFELEVELIVVDFMCDEYWFNFLLCESGLIEVYSVDEVVVFNYFDGEWLFYVLFFLFKYCGGLVCDESFECYYYV